MRNTRINPPAEIPPRTVEGSGTTVGVGSEPGGGDAALLGILAAIEPIRLAEADRLPTQRID
jgi:hypothetical protein